MLRKVIIFIGTIVGVLLVIHLVFMDCPKCSSYFPDGRAGISIKVWYFCSCDRYDEGWILGKDSADIEEKDGEYYNGDTLKGSDGLIRSQTAWYLLNKPFDAGIGKMPPLYYTIRFDENGVAVEIGRSMGPQVT